MRARSAAAVTRLAPDALRDSPVFVLVVLVTLGLVGLIGVVLLQPGLVGGLLGQEIAGHIGGHFREPQHRVHDLTFGFVFGTSVVGMLVQLWKPAENPAGQLMAVIPWVALGLVAAVTDRWVFAPLPILGALTVLATVLHPAGPASLRAFAVSRVNRVMLAILVVAALPLLASASASIGLQTTIDNDHAALGHYGFMAAFSLTVVAAGLLASLRPRGWWLPAWVAGLLPAGLGFASLLFPDADSSLDPAWAIAAVAWGAAFVAVAEFTQDSESPTLLGAWRR